jgi:hypothetical protein
MVCFREKFCNIISITNRAIEGVVSIDIVKDN